MMQTHNKKWKFTYGIPKENQLRAAQSTGQ